MNNNSNNKHKHSGDAAKGLHKHCTSHQNVRKGDRMNLGKDPRGKAKSSTLVQNENSLMEVILQSFLFFFSCS